MADSGFENAGNQELREIVAALMVKIGEVNAMKTQVESVKSAIGATNQRINRIKVTGVGHSGTAENMRFEAAQIGGGDGDGSVSVLDNAAYVTFNGTVYKDNTIFGIVGTPL